MRLVPITILQLAIGAGWTVLGVANLLVIGLTGGAPLFGWWQALLLGVVLAVVMAGLVMLTLHRALRNAASAAGVDLAAPSVAVGRALGPVGFGVVVMVALALVPGAVEVRGLAAMLFACVGVSYVPLAGWVRRFEEMQGVLAIQPINRWGLRTGPAQALRLPR